MGEAALEYTEKNYKKAEKIYSKLCKLQQTNPSHWVNLAANLKGQRKVYSSHKIIQRGLTIAPNNKELLQALAQSFSERGQQQQAKFVIKNIVENIKINSMQDIFQLQFMSSSYNLLSPEELRQIAHSWEDSKVNKTEITKNGRQKKGDKIRIGYFSSDFCNHPVGRFISGVIENHNATDFEVYLLDTGSKKDTINLKLEQKSSKMINLSSKSAKQIDNVIRNLDLDILIELGGYSNLSRLDALINKPAPLQLSYLGYPAPTYLNAIDGWIGDQIVFSSLSVTNKKDHKLHAIKGGYMAYSNIKDYPVIRKNTNFQRKFRFGSFNHSRKLTSNTIGLWVRIMEENPCSELVLKSVSFNEAGERLRVKNQFIKAGLDSNRLIILTETKSQTEHLHLYSEIDIALDPVPYSGATTTFDALMMGVPVITLSGKEMIGQLSSSILYYGGLKRWIAKNSQEYLKIANKAYYTGVRSYNDRLVIRQVVANSELTNCKRLSKELEGLYQILISKHSD